MEENEKIPTKDQQDYQSGVGMMLYLVKPLCLDLANATKELSKANEGANHAAYKELLCVIKYVIDTKNLGLKTECMGNSNKPWEILCFSDNDYAVDLVSRQSISGFIFYVLGVSLLAIQNAKKCLPYQLRGRVYCLICNC